MQHDQAWLGALRAKDQENSSPDAYCTDGSLRRVADLLHLCHSSVARPAAALRNSGQEPRARPSLPGPAAGHPLPGTGGHRQSPKMVNSALQMVAISLDTCAGRPRW